MDFGELRTFLRQHLLEHVMPFWTKHAVDWRNGGLFTCIADDGAVECRHKYVWSNARALYTFSALVNRIEDREEWRRVADGLYAFLRRCGRDEAGRWVFLVDEQGAVLAGERSIVVDAFAIFGLVEYFRLTGNEEALELARETALNCRQRLARPFSYKTAPYPTPAGMKAHREYMQFSLAFAELGHELNDDDMLEAGLERGRQVLDCFYRRERQVLLEYVYMDGTERDAPEGRVMVPGHALESLWFQVHNFARVGDAERARQAARAMRCGFEKGWDPEYGGLLLGIDVDGKEPPYWKNATKKLWWPFTEALPGALMAYEQLGEEWCLEWYWRCHEWALAHFPDWQHGEWTQRLDRRGRKTDEVVALPVKDPFHLPRGLIVAIQTLERLATKSGDERPTEGSNRAQK